MKNKARISLYIIMILLVGIMSAACNSEGKLFEKKNIIGLNITYLDQEKINKYESESGEKYPYTHLLEITNNSNELIKDGYVFFDFVNDSGIQEEINTNFHTIAPGESYFTYIKSTKKDISPSQIIYTLKESLLQHTLSFENKKVQIFKDDLVELIDFNEHNIIDIDTKETTLEEKGYMTNIFVNTHNFNFINNSNVDIQNVSAKLYFYDEDKNIIDVLYPFCSLAPYETKSTYAQEDVLPTFTKEAVSTELVSYNYIIYDKEKNYKWNYHIDLQNKIAYKQGFSVN